MRPLIACLLLVATAAGCHRGNANDRFVADAPQGPRRDVLALFPPPPLSRLNDTTGTADAQQFVYGTLLSVDSLHQYYRTRAQAMGWALQSDVLQDTLLAMYFTKDSNTVWIKAWRDELITRFSLIASTSRPDARPDSVRGFRPPRHPR